MFADVILEIGGKGYRVTYDKLPTLSRVPSKPLFRVEMDDLSKLTTEGSSKQTEDITIVLADADSHFPTIEIGAASEAEINADKQQQAQIKKLAKAVMDSDNVQQAITLIADFDKASLAHKLD